MYSVCSSGLSVWIGEIGKSWDLINRRYTDKKENIIFLIYKEIKRVQGHVWQTASSYMGKNLRISSYIRRPFLINDFAPDPIWISLYMRKILFNFYQCMRMYDCEHVWRRVWGHEEAAWPQGLILSGNERRWVADNSRQGSIQLIHTGTSLHRS
jgi:hypothetical protein